MKLHSERGEVESLYIVDETKENFLYAMPVDTDEQLQYRITFPAEGTKYLPLHAGLYFSLKCRNPLKLYV
ncbi:Uncharacterised protein [Streptococcus pneumoniae]|nr:Uncharacterised protein [Streptococcus pneumoniae]